jgi:hypothetical protein
MKITIKLTTNQFEVLHSLLPVIDAKENPNFGRETRLRREILAKPVIKIQKMMIDVKSSRNLFNQKKKISLSLEYYEAHFLEKWLEVFDVANTKEDINRWNVIKAIRALLNEKLA